MRDSAQKEIAPRVREIGPQRRIPPEIGQGMAPLGLLAPVGSGAHGGADMDWTMATIAAEGLGRAGISPAVPVLYLVEAAEATWARTLPNARFTSNSLYSRRSTLKVFIAGIMQGSRLDRYIDDQDYRRIITQAILDRYPDLEVMDPNELHPNGVDYDDETAKTTLLAMAELASRADLVVAYAPKASMGTAIEMWQAFQAGVPVVTISSMTANWVIRHISDVVLPDLAAFESWVADRGLDKLVDLH